MAVSEHTIVINRPIDLVFRNTTCMKGCVNWMSTIMKAEKLDDEPVHVGTQYRHTYKFMGDVGETNVTVKIYHPPYEFAFVDPSIPVEFHYTFEEVPGGTRVHCRITLTAPARGNLDGDMIAAGVAKQFDVSLQNLKTMLESDVLVQMD